MVHMTPDPIKVLTHAQKQALRLVADGFETGQIASKLGISEAAVTDRIERARSKFNGAPRKQLARMLVHAERVMPPSELGLLPYSEIGHDSSKIGHSRDATDVGGVMEERTVFDQFDGLRRVALLGSRARSSLVILSAISLLIMAALLKPALDGLGWVGRAIGSLFR